MSFGYIRVCDEQVDGTVEQQKHHLIYFQEKNGFPVNGFYIDNCSPFVEPMNRDGFKRMYNELVRRHKDMVVLDASVLTCRISDYNSIMDLFEKIDIKVYSVFHDAEISRDTELIDLSTTIKPYLDELDREKKARIISYSKHKTKLK